MSKCYGSDDTRMPRPIFKVSSGTYLVRFDDSLVWKKKNQIIDRKKICDELNRDFVCDYFYLKINMK